MAGIYFHIPFCKQACHYCDFHFSTNREKQSELIAAMKKELILQRDYLKDHPVLTLYFGGGTPSLLTASEIDSIVQVTTDYHQLAGQMEVTLEANPDDLTIENLDQLRQTQINRLSIGIQSFNDSLLKTLNRSHDRKTAIDSYYQARNSGFHNINIDLIYAIPGLTLSQWKKNLQHALALDPEHISAYTLTIEPDTVFGRWARAGRFHGVEEDEAANQMELLVEMLTFAGYEQYEVSNFCKPGFPSLHNSSYWNQDPYLGIGPSAHSYDGVSRQSNVRNNHRYMKSIDIGLVPFQREVLSRTDRINEYLFTSLRTAKGCDLEKLRNEFHLDILATHGTYVGHLTSRNLAVLEGTTMKLTPSGRLLADKIAADLFVLDQAQ
jgi:putative oxygen-independent coproporphyrinogen III oxidase